MQADPEDRLKVREWIASDALYELTSATVQKRLKTVAKKPMS